MSTETSAEMFKRGMDWLRNHRKTYLESGGCEGHIIDLSANGGRPFATHLLLRYVGRKTGKTYINPLLYGVLGGEVVIVASKAGADQHPAWYLNLIDSKEVEFQIGTHAFRGTWREPAPAERAKLWDFMVSNHPPFVDYQSKTSRQIPIVCLRAVQDIPIFTAADSD